MKSRYMIGIVTCFLLVCLVFCGYITRKNRSDDKPGVPLYAAIEDNEGAECIISAYTQDENTYFFLPSYTDMSRVKLHTEEKVYINNNSVTDDASCDKYQLNRSYKLTVNNKDKGNIIFMRSSAVATMYIDTVTKSMDRIYRDKEYKEQVKVQLIDEKGEINYSGEKDELKGRGQTSWSYEQLEKKPFSLDLQEPYGLLGMKEGNKWALLANAKDRTNIKNKMVCDFAKDIGFCAPSSEYVDLYLNGEYNGLYLLSEKVDCVREIGFKENGSDFLFLRDFHPDVIAYNFRTNDDQPIVLKQPAKCDNEKFESLKKHVQSMENSILSESGTDKTTGKQWTELIDVDSWIKKYLIEEVFMNSDGGFNSQYFYWMPDSGDKIYAGPAWDYDIVLSGRTGKVFMLGQETLVSDITRTSWYRALYKKDEFYNALVKEYKESFLPKLERLRDTDIDVMAGKLKDASYMNGIRWQGMVSTGSEGEALDRLKDRLTEHTEFLSSAWIEGKEYCNVRFKRENAATKYAPYAVEKGKPFEDMPTNKELAVDENTVWCYGVNGDVFDPSAPVMEDIDLYEKGSDKAKRSQNSITNKIKSLIPLMILIIPLVISGILVIILIVLVVFDIRRNKDWGNRE